MADLSGPHKSFVWFHREGRHYPPGTMVVLTHEEAVRAAEQKTARPLTQEELEAVNEAPASVPEPAVEPAAEAKPEPPPQRAGTGPRRGRGGPPEPAAPAAVAA